jgi:hypothetical protein
MSLLLGLSPKLMTEVYLLPFRLPSRISLAAALRKKLEMMWELTNVFCSRHNAQPAAFSFSATDLLFTHIAFYFIRKIGQIR